jgi:hypothetical protein
VPQNHGRADWPEAIVGTRQETISRIENGKQTASVKLVDRIDRALQKAVAKRTKR